MRLTPIGYEIGLASEHRHELMLSKRDQRDCFIEWCASTNVKATADINERLSSLNSAPLSASVKVADLVRRPGVDFSILAEVFPPLRERMNRIEEERRAEIVQAAEIMIKYDGYIKRERENAGKQQRLEYVRIPSEFDFMTVSAISTEARQKLDRVRPATIGQASRIPGVSPSDINVLLILLGR